MGARFTACAAVLVYGSLLCGAWGVARADASEVDGVAGVPDARAAAADHHRRGVRAFAQGRYAEAIDLFRKADALKPSAAIAYNVARAYARLGDAAGALAAYREYLRRAPDTKDAVEVGRQIRRFEKRLAARGVQQLTVLSQPLAATVLIDGKPVGVTPYTDELNPGPHTLELRMRGFVSTIRGFELPTDAAQEIEIALRAEEAGPPAATPEPTTPAPQERESSPPPQIMPAMQYAREPQPDAPRAEERLVLRRSGESDETIGTASVLGWVAAGTGVAALGGALGFELLRRAEESRARNAATQIEFAERLDTMETQQTAARVLAGVGGGLSAIGVLLLIAGAHEGGPSTADRGQPVRAQVTASLMLGRGAAGAKLWARY